MCVFVVILIALSATKSNPDFNLLDDDEAVEFKKDAAKMQDQSLESVEKILLNTLVEVSFLFLISSVR